VLGLYESSDDFQVFFVPMVTNPSAAGTKACTMASSLQGWTVGGPWAGRAVKGGARRGNWQLAIAE